MFVCVWMHYILPSPARITTRYPRQNNITAWTKIQLLPAGQPCLLQTMSKRTTTGPLYCVPPETCRHDQDTAITTSPVLPNSWNFIPGTIFWNFPPTNQMNVHFCQQEQRENRQEWLNAPKCNPNNERDHENQQIWKQLSILFGRLIHFSKAVLCLNFLLYQLSVYLYLTIVIQFS
jgi:hypothetical protein